VAPLADLARGGGDRARSRTRDRDRAGPRLDLRAHRARPRPFPHGARLRGDAAGRDRERRSARRLRPHGDRFRILFAAPQVHGALHLSAAPGDTASGEIAGDDDADLLVLPDGLGIRNHPFSTAEYHVAVPRHIAEVEVEVAGHATWRGSPEQLAPSGVRVDLTEGLDRSADR
jgi:hypothetical protein